LGWIVWCWVLRESKLGWVVLQNKNLPVDFFENHLDKVDWRGLSENTNLPGWVLKHIVKLNWAGLSENNNLPVDFLEGFVSKLLHFCSRKSIGMGCLRFLGVVGSFALAKLRERCNIMHNIVWNSNSPKYSAFLETIPGYTLITVIQQASLAKGPQKITKCHSCKLWSYYFMYLAMQYIPIVLLNKFTK
jgi:uncharacterized membrane protein